ncbi:hypothetical protein KR215_003693, partial [Drosophila sulfurigaster]
DDLVNDIVDDILQLRRGHYEESASEVDLEPLSRSSKCFVDRRLQYWKNMLRQRRILQKRLTQDIGKQPQKILFNMDYRKHQTIRRTLSPDCTECLEIVGVPRRTTQELLGEEGTRSSEISSDHYPKSSPVIKKLEVIGRNCWSKMLLGSDSLHTISSVTSNTMRLHSTPYSTQNRGTMTATLSAIINGIHFSLNDPGYSPILEKMFVCTPFENFLRTIIIIENNGQRPINFYWKSSQFFAYNDTLMTGTGDEFVFDTEPFQLRSGEIRKVNVLFRPIKVGIVKQRWMLTSKPKIFQAHPYALTLDMHGRCKPPLEYMERIESMMKVPIRKCRRFSEMHRFNRSLPPDEDTGLCPFTREIEEREAFNRRNVGFHCDRISDLCAIKDFFEQVKLKTCDTQWDFSVSMLIHLVCCNEQQSQRIALFAELKTLLDNLRGRSLPLSLSDEPTKLEERRRTRFIYVRGVIANNIELWEEKIWALGAQMLRTSHFQGLIYSKRLRDSIYIYTYEQLCNVVEDIVSVIESTEHV